MDIISSRKPLLANYAYRIRDVRSWENRHAFIVSEIPEVLWDDLLRETLALPLGDPRSLRDVRSWWSDIVDPRGDWQADLSAEADFLAEEEISSSPTFHMITNYSYADGLAAPDFNGRLVRALCFCDEFGRVHYTDVASGTQGIGGVARIEARHTFKDVVITRAAREFASPQMREPSPYPFSGA
jgi:hypothetical protein